MSTPVPTSETDPLIITVLCNHYIMGYSIVDSASWVARRAFVQGTTITGDARDYTCDFKSSLFLLSDEDAHALSQALVSATNLNSEAGEVRMSLTTLLVIVQDLKDLSRGNITRLSQWAENTEHVAISSETTAILQKAFADHNVPSYFRALHDRHVLPFGLVEEVGELRFLGQVVAPIARLFTETMAAELLKSTPPLALLCGDTKGAQLKLVPTLALQYGDESASPSFQPDILVKHGDCICLCGVVCGMVPTHDDDVEAELNKRQETLAKAWEKAISVVLSAQPCSPHTVVMAVRDTYVRIGLLTLRDEVEYLSDELQGALRRAGAHVMLEPNDGTVSSLKLVNQVEFGATGIDVKELINILRQYFLFVTQKMLSGFQKAQHAP